MRPRALWSTGRGGSQRRGVAGRGDSSAPGVREAAHLRATRERGYQYFGVADHSKSGQGLSVDEVLQQHRAIDRLNKSYGKDFRILKGIESDILADGSLDYPDDVLERRARLICL
jgi:histidinol phosphatase-like PHP family hydrolase